MSPSHVLQPTYASIRHCLISGLWPAGQRLEAARLAEELGVSITPVRDSLNRLVGERLAELTPGDGFRVPYRSEQHLKDLLGFNLQVLRLAIAASAPGMTPPLPTPVQVDLAARVDALFQSLGTRSGSNELSTTISSLNGRLHATRRVDERVWDEDRPEIMVLERLTDGSAPTSELLASLDRYHQARIARVSVYIRELDLGLPRA